uniref:Macaca fascicularis brain cDNA, clone: QflA-19838 n=1 Tax=Macaca fascicularis TaxID=9541 RepID=I7GN83_MACFA|nr:unnamed protein product [Macaca fascicularis]
MYIGYFYNFPDELSDIKVVFGPRARTRWWRLLVSPHHLLLHLERTATSG